MLCASITCMIRHYVARRAKVIFDHPHNADERAFRAGVSSEGEEPRRPPRCTRESRTGRS
jgi:hypothetical protein